MMERSSILNHAGVPMIKAQTPYNAADYRSQEMALWNPPLTSADAEILPYRDRMMARVHDIARNDGWSSGALQKHLDCVVGAGFILQALPDWRALGIDREAAHELADQIETEWRLYANDPDMFCDATRRSQMAGIFALNYRHRLLDDENISILMWMDQRPGRYNTAVQVIDPDRLSNPFGDPDTNKLRGGVELDEFGAPVAYHIRKGHPGDYGISFANTDEFEWVRVSRETSFGRPICLHDMERRRAGQNRGAPTILAILKKTKMLQNYDDAEMQAAVMNAIWAAWIESPFDHDALSGALAGGSMQDYNNQRIDYYADNPLRVGGVKIPLLWAGEKMNFMDATRPNSNYPDFIKAGLRNIAATQGLSYEQVSADWSETNYSSARAAMNEVWRFLSSRSAYFKEQFCRRIYLAWLEEAFASNRVQIPSGAPDFQDARAAYTTCEWIGPGRGYVDPDKEAKGQSQRLANNLTTYQREAAEQGRDWRRDIDVYARENELLRDLGLPGADRSTTPSQEQADAQPAAE